jgi:hypothetical protein
MLRSAREDQEAVRGTTQRRWPDQVLDNLEARLAEAKAVLASRAASVAYDVSRGGGDLASIGSALVVLEHETEIRALVARYVDSPAGREALGLRPGTKAEYDTRLAALALTVPAIERELAIRDATDAYQRVVG